jgi:cytochrome P450
MPCLSHLGQWPASGDQLDPLLSGEIPNLRDKNTALRSLPPGLGLPAPAQTWLFWKWPFWYLELYRRRFGTSFTLNATSYPPLVFLCEPADIKAVFTAPADALHPGGGLEPVRPILGERSFMLLEGDEHLLGRRAILPAFHASAIQQHVHLVSEVVERHVASWPADVPFALHPFLRALTLEVILRTVLGIPADIGDAPLSALADKLLAMLTVTGSPVLSAPLLRHGPGRRVWERFLRDRDEVDRLLYVLIDERRRAGRGTGDALTILLEARNRDGSPMSNAQVRDNLVSLILAGHETTASSLAWAFQLLAHHQGALDRLTAEIDNGDDTAYMTAAIQEVLRHRSAVLFPAPRAVRQPIEIGELTYRPPAQLLACTYLVHHDPAIYPEPQAFRPERFLQTPPKTYTWLPWGGGPRRCPGVHLATLEMETVLRAVLSTRTVRPASKKVERPRWRSVIVTPGNGSRVVLHRRPTA